MGYAWQLPPEAFQMFSFAACTWSHLRDLGLASKAGELQVAMLYRCLLVAQPHCHVQRFGVGVPLLAFTGAHAALGGAKSPGILNWHLHPRIRCIVPRGFTFLPPS